MAVVIDIDQKDALKVWIQTTISEGAKRGMLSAAQRLVGVIQNELIPNEKPAPVDTAAYRQGWQAEPTKEGADVYNTLPYASVIEYGARAENIKISRPMIDALVEWVMRKGLSPKPRKNDNGEAMVAARNMAWAIAVSMKQKGIFNRPGSDPRGGLRIGEKAVRRLRDFIDEEIAREMAR